MALFYMISYLRRPGRFFQLVRNVRNKDPKTKLETALVRVMKKRDQLKRTNQVETPRSSAELAEKRKAA
jgi:hypothetical protein